MMFVLVYWRMHKGAAPRTSVIRFATLRHISRTVIEEKMRCMTGNM